MKLSPLIGQYLQANKSVQIEGFGRFYIDDAAYAAEEGDRSSKNTSPIRFQYVPNIATDAEFINFVIKETGKIRPLAIADLETFTSLAKQLLNISKPFVIEGVGTLVNNNKGVYDFIPGHFEPPKINTESEREKKLRSAGDQASTERLSEENYQYGREAKKSFSIRPKQALLIVVGVLFAGFAAWAVIRYLNKKEKPAAEKTTTAEKPAVATTGSADTTQQKKAPAPVVFTDSNQVITYKVIHEVANKARAEARYAKLKSYNDATEMEAIDSATYKLFVRVSSAVRDTGRKKDAIRANYKNAIYKGPAYIEFQ
ncbi:MAG: hypothetical protein JNM68_06415 [Dinghuibacter sp.]|nr:hypothetical protein [Dinghuibacter sp.]